MNLFVTKAIREVRKKKLRSFPLILIIFIGGIICLLYSSLYLNWIGVEESSWDDLKYHHLLLTVKPTNSSQLSALIEQAILKTEIDVDYELRSFFEVLARSDPSENNVPVYLYGIPNRELTVDNLYYHPGYTRQLKSTSTANDIVLDKVTAQTNGWAIGERLSLETTSGLLNGTIVAYVESPEFMIKPGIITEFYGGWDGPILWMRNQDLITNFNTSNIVNQLTFHFNTPSLRGKFLDQMLAEFEETFGVDSVLQINGRNTFLSAIGPTFSVMSTAFIFVFGGISAIMIFIVIKRIIEEELRILGLFKSLGFNTREIISSTLIYSWIIGISGSILGGVFGILIGIATGSFYIELVGIKALPTVSIDVIFILPIIAGVYVTVTLIFTTMGALLASRKVIRLSAVDTMRPQALLNPSRPSIVERLISMVRKSLSPISRFSIRSVFQDKRKTSFIIFGILLATAISFFGVSVGSSFNAGLAKKFDFYQTWDAQVFLGTFENESEISEILNALTADFEPFITTPVRITQDKTQIYSVLGLKEDSTMRQFDSGRVPDTDQIALTKDLAIKCRQEKGEMLALTDLLGNEHLLLISEVLTEMSGSGLYTNLETAKTLSGLNGTNLINGIYLRSNNLEMIKSTLSDNPLVSKIISKDELESSLKEIGQIGVSVFMFGATGAALVVGISIIITIVSITISERRISFTNFRALGISNKEIFMTIFLELVISGVCGISLGLVAGYGLAQVIFTWAAEFGVVFLFTLSIESIIITVSTIVIGMLCATYLSLRAFFRTSIAEETVSRIIG